MPRNTLEVLIVEDSPPQAAYLQAILERNHFAVRRAERGTQALEALTERLPHLVVTDIVMPGMDGYELCRRIKSDDRFKQVPVILLTALADLKDVIKGLECAADSFVVKPYDEKDLLTRIEYVLANAEVRAEHEEGQPPKGRLEVFFGGSRHFLSTMPKVEKAIDLLLGAYQTLIEKNNALTSAKREAERASRAKSEFLSRMSHELRTPLNAILGFAQLLELDETDESKQQSLDQILNGGNHLIELISEVLDVSRIEAGRMKVIVEVVELGELLEDVLDFARPLAAKQNIQLLVPESRTGQSVLGDRQRLRQVLLNLVSNAIKYNREGGTVTIRCEQFDETKGFIAVHDTGRGIAADKLDRLFTPFERLDAENSSIEGTGLGLALSKGLVEAMNGTITVESIAGEGTTFTVTLPIAARREREEPPPAVIRPLAERKVLCIEDDPAFVELIARILQTRPEIKITAALNGAAALELTRTESFDLILLDFQLPDMKGHELFRCFQSDPRTCGVPVVVMSGQVNAAQIQRLFPLESARYLQKPFDVLEFIAALDEVAQLASKEPRISSEAAS